MNHLLKHSSFGLAVTFASWLAGPSVAQQGPEVKPHKVQPSAQRRIDQLSGGQRQRVAVARAAAFARHVVILDEPTAALGVKEGNMVLELIRRVRDKGLPVILISHNMPHVFEIADRIHVARLAGVPKAVLKRARQVLATLEQWNVSLSEREKSSARSEGGVQLTLFAPATHPALDRLLALDIDELSPREAWDTLFALQAEARRG